MNIELKDGILNTSKGKRPYKVRIHGQEKISSFATHEAAKKASETSLKDATEEAHDIQSFYTKSK